MEHRNHDDIEYKVIGIRPAVLELIESIESEGRRVRGFSFNGSTQEIAPSLLDEQATREILGRPLSKGELGCARSHQLAYESYKYNANWVIFLEDDVEIVGSLVDIESKIMSFPNTPMMILFEPNNVGRVKLPRKYRRSRSHAYALNLEALRLIQTNYSKILTVADWPIQWAFKMDYFLLGQSTFVVRGDCESLIDSDRSKLVQNQDYMWKLRRKIWPIRFFLIYRHLARLKIRKPISTAYYGSRSGMY